MPRVGDRGDKGTDDVYERLAAHLDRLPAGFPRTQGGAEMRILRRLFSPEEAELALHLTLIAEEARVVARRARRPVEETARLLEGMEGRGLLYAVHRPGRAPRYMAAQFVVGLYEYQVNKLTPELVVDVEEYLPQWWDRSTWQEAPQLRTIPVGESVGTSLAVMDYERAEELVRGQRHISVAPCVCRQEQALAGHPCSKPLQTCLGFGVAADFYVRNGMGRTITEEEALAILNRAEEAGLVLQPGNSRDALNICICCGCCCGVLRVIKQHPRPATMVSSAFRAVATPDGCAGCGACLDRCQMEALTLQDGRVALDVERCIGCGLCVPTCPTGSLALERKPDAEQPYVPRDIVETTIRMARSRGRLRLLEMIGLGLRSAVDRMLAR